ncbi:hypothetical protein KBD71_00310 [Candidatus Woesebacteria bacterium]|nr:hypothetical protein [Candidatus Woesebacteria bacterium]
MKNPVRNFFLRHWLFWITLLGFTLLLARNPFSERTLIANFEPYPDSFHYILPARNLLMGKGFSMDRLGKIVPGVPPFYSLVFVPFFAILNDPRMVYVANVLLSLLSLVIFYALVRKFFSAGILQLFLCLLFVTHPILVWYPTLAMAENLQLLLTLLGLYMLCTRPTSKKYFLGGALTISYYATKFASIPVSAVYGLVFFAKSIVHSIQEKSWKPVVLFIAGALVCLTLYLSMEYSIRQTTELHMIANVLFPKPAQISGTAGDAPAVPDQTFFSVVYVKDHAPQYLRWLTGESLPLLWKQEVLLPRYLAVLSLVGIGIGFFDKKYRLFSLTAVGMYVATIGFMSMFYVVDARYFYHAIPVALLGVGIAGTKLYELAKSRSLWVGIGIAGLLLFYLMTNFSRLKFQLSLNLKYAESPWYYVSVRKVDAYLSTQQFEKEPVVISPVPPFLFDFYAKSPMIMLPLHKEQEFRNARTQTWGEHDYTNLTAVYTKYLNQGYPVYLSTYGLGNEGFLHQARAQMEKDFRLTLVMDECFSLCKVYKVEPLLEVSTKDN